MTLPQQRHTQHFLLDNGQRAQVLAAPAKEYAAKPIPEYSGGGRGVPRRVRTGVRIEGSSVESADWKLASLMPASWNQITSWLRRVDEIKGAA